MNSFTYYKADDFIVRAINNFELNIPLIIDGITEELFPAVKSKLIAEFGAGAAIVVLNLQGESEDIAASSVEYTERLIVKAGNFLSRDYFTFGDLLEIVRKLRDPDGCPWDKEQTHESIRSCAIEEAYELAEAVDLKDKDKIIEESGDVMLQGLFHSVIAESKGEFSTADVINGLCHKLITRHTHIFGSNKAWDAAEALKYWDKAKAEEKEQKTLSDKIASVPVTFGALMKAAKIQKIIKKTGFDFPDYKASAAKIYEETEELLSAQTPENREEEGGDLLFAVVNTLRLMGIDPELALNATTAKFIARFKYVEKKAEELGFSLTPDNFELMEKYYQESKQQGI